MGLKDFLPFAKFFRRDPHAPAAMALYAAAVVQAREPAFYARLGVADSVDGRFDMVALHVFLLLRRLRKAGPEAAGLSQAIFDIMFADMDQNLREMGVGDLGVGKKVKRMAEAFYGRVAAYDAGLDGNAAALEAALARNLYRGAAPATPLLAAMAAYVRGQDQALAGQDAAALLAGRAVFAPVEAP